MQDAGYADLQIIPSFKGFQPALEHGTHGALIGAGTSGGRKYGDAAGRSLVSSFATHARRAALVGAGILAAGIGAAGYAAFNLGKSSLAEAEEARRVGALTAQVIKTTGQAAGVTAMEVGNLAEQLSNKTGVDDEVIQRGANMILTFKNISNEVGKGNNIFNRAVKITEDMSAAMAGGQGGGQLDLKSSAILVGKALNDPAKGLTALTRVGVSFTDQQKKNIETLLEQNKVSEAQRIILGELKSEFGGAAAAQATLGDKVDVAWGNIQERLGKVILPLVHKVQRAFLREGVPALEKFSDWFAGDGIDAITGFVSDAKPKVEGFIRDVRPLAEEVLPAASSVLGDIRDVLGEAAPYAADMVRAFNDMPDWAKKGVAIGGLGAYAGGKAGLFSRGGLGSSILGGISKSAPLPVVVTNPGFGAPGVPGGPGGPKVPPIIPTGAPGVLGGFSTLLAGIGFTGATYFDKAGGGAKNGLPGVDSLPGQDEFQSIIRYREELDAAAEDFATLPKALQTHIIFSGGPESRREASLLAKQFDLTAKDRTTLFRTSGIPTARDDSKHLLDLYKQMNGTFTGDVYVNTGDSESRLNRILALMNAISHRGALQAAGALPSSSSSSSSPRKAGGTHERRGATINIHLDGKKVGEVFDERIGTNDDLVAEQRRAGAPG